MSGAALDDSSWKMDIPDDLESLFYVMLWHAIKYLPHNCANVGGLLHKLFDEAEWTGSKCAGGTNKRLAMVDGCISFTGADGKSTALAFHSRDVPETPHPMNQIIDGIIGSFQEYYTHSGKAKKRVERDEELAAFMEETGTTKPLMDKEVLTKLRRSANHAYFEKLFNLYLDIPAMKEKWPIDDKTADQVPKNYEYERTQRYQAALRAGKLLSGKNVRIKRSHPPQDDTEPTAGPGPTTAANGMSRKRVSSSGPSKRHQPSNDGVVGDPAPVLSMGPPPVPMLRRRATIAAINHATEEAGL